MRKSMKTILAAMAVAVMAVSAMAVSASAECVSDNTNQDEGGFTAFCGTIMLDDTSAAEAPSDEAAAEPESTFHWMGPASANNSEEENKNEDNPDELREEEKSEKTKTLETVSKALNPIKELTGVDDKIIDTGVDKLNDKFVKDTGHELPKEEKIFFTETGKILYNTVEGTFMGEIVPGIGGYRAMVKFNELMSKAQDAKTPELRDKYLKEAQRCCREGIVKCIPGGSVVLTGTELVLSTTKYAINKTFGTDFDFDVNPLHWELPESKQNIKDILDCGQIKDVPQNQDVANIKEYIKNMRSGF